MSAARPSWDEDLGPELSAEEMPWREGENDDVIINWDYENGDGETLRDRKRRWEDELREGKGDEWVSGNQRSLDAQFVEIVVQGFLT